MSNSLFPAILVEKNADGTQSASVTQLKSCGFLPNRGGDLLIRVTHSSLNYKDGLAVTGKGKVLRRFPIVPGIDLAGTVEVADAGGKFRVGQEVLVTGYGIGENFSGGYAGFCSVNADWVFPLPKGFSAEESMAVGTAGLTAMLSLLALEEHGVVPANGPVLVTGAAGGVGSLAILILSKLGYHVAASSGRIDEYSDYFRNLGASELIHRDELAAPSGRPLDSERWAGAIDSVGGETLASILRQTQYRGSVAACGLAGGVDLPVTVLPFILRGINLLGIDSVFCSRSLRAQAWERIATTIDPTQLRQLYRVIPLRGVPAASEEILAGKVRGRIVVDLTREA